MRSKSTPIHDLGGAVKPFRWVEELLAAALTGREKRTTLVENKRWVIIADASLSSSSCKPLLFCLSQPCGINGVNYAAAYATGLLVARRLPSSALRASSRARRRRPARTEGGPGRRREAPPLVTRTVECRFLGGDDWTVCILD
jgi:hypothetical protein